MAVDKLVDSTKLDACLDAEADAIRAKTGGSADIPFDFANNKGFADAIAAIPSGGGTVYTGTVELTNVTARELIIPVDVSNAEEFEVLAYCDRTGTVSGGVVTYDDEPTCAEDYSSTSNAFAWYIAGTEIRSTKNMKRDASNYTTQNRPNNASYCYMHRGNNGGVAGLIVDPVYNNQIKLGTGNAGRRYCLEGLYARFAYTVVVY